MSAPLSILIVGAGMGGLTAATYLAEQGHRVHVIERSAHKGGVGFAFRLTPNADRVLKALGIDSIAGGACPSRRNVMYDNQGNLVMENTENDDVAKSAPSSVFAFRPQVLQQLWDAAVKLGVTIETGVKVNAVDADAGKVQLQDGRELTADLIIGADGLHSVVRPQIIDASKHFPTQSTGMSAFRWMVPAQAAMDDPKLGELYKGMPGLISWSDPDKRLLAYPVDYGKQINLVASFPKDLVHIEDTVDYDRSLPPDQARAVFQEFPSVVERFFALAPPDGFRAWPLHDMEQLPQWHRGRALILGDAAHPVLPFSFSGASMALEDAAVLGGLLPRGVPATALEARLKAWEELRMGRTAHVREMGRVNARDAATREEIQAYFDFLREYDAVGEAKKKLAELERQAA